VQVVIALIVTPEGFPIASIACEMLPGNTSDKTTLRDMLRKIEAQYGKENRIWVMDRGIPTEEVLAEMRGADPPVFYLVGTPKGQDQELYVFAQSHARVHKERAMRQRKPKWLWVAA
jgi:transposase